MTALRRTPGKLRRVGKGPTPDGFTLNRPYSLAWSVSGVLALLLVAGWLSRLV